ncbi:MFS transporter [Aquibacillus salsiterrae]|uniref:MFS transporter n=1 Tax=Aquibacillus salsiterrae TaxID=2950439 RepID=A0A9X4AGK3_9BACI|nr:MFS transporter [Aquibacillus salsiterrae]MDC3417370.1 MFS transporter [Aquibacillus salsiterrae]
MIVVFGGFTIFGISENIKGPAIPKIQADFQVSESQLGILLALNALGFLIACLYTSTLINKIGVKLTSIILFSAMALSGYFIYLSNSFFMLSASYFFLNVGNGMLEISLAIIAARIFTKNTGTMLNLSHFFYGLGSTVAPIFATSMMGWVIFNSELGWRGMYLIMLSFSLLPIIPVVLSNFSNENTIQGERTSIKGLTRDRIAWLIVFALTFGVVAELGMASWLVNYLIKVYDWTLDEASKLLSVFFLLFMFARLLLGPVTDKFGYTKSVIIFSGLAGISSLAAISIGEEAAILFAIAGIWVAPIYPTMMALLAKRYAKGTDSAITFTVSLIGIGSIVGNLLIGYIIELFSNWFNNVETGKNIAIGMQAGYSFIALNALLCAGFSLIIFILLKKENSVI